MNNEPFKPVEKGVSLEAPHTVIHPNLWNPNHMTDEMFEQLKYDITKLGFTSPVIVREHPTKEGEYEIVNGEHRFRAMKDLGSEKIPVYNLGAISDTQAKALTVTLNEVHGEADWDQLSVIVRDLEDEGADLDVLPYTDIEIRNLIDEADLGELEDTIGHQELDGVGDEEEKEVFDDGKKTDVTREPRLEDVLSINGLSKSKQKVLLQKVETIMAVNEIGKSQGYKVLEMAIENLHKETVQK